MYRLYYEDEFLYESNNEEAIQAEMAYHVKHVLKKEPHYLRFVQLDDNRVMIDYGSHHTFYYVLNVNNKKPFGIH
jgi:hypothetical protein